VPSDSGGGGGGFLNVASLNLARGESAPDPGAGYHATAAPARPNPVDVHTTRTAAHRRARPGDGSPAARHLKRRRGSEPGLPATSGDS
jgi:hypothetical protein